MTQRERFINVYNYAETDRIPMAPGNGRKSTLERWHREGLPAAVRNGAEAALEACRQAGFEPELPVCRRGCRFDHRMMPQFPEKVLEVRANSQIVQDWKGNICEIGLEFDPSYLSQTLDFVTRSWIKCPVENRQDWAAMKKRYDPSASGRLDPADGALAGHDNFVGISLPGPYWQLREWCGFEGLSLLFYDDPALVEEMIHYWQEFVVALLQRLFAVFVPDQVHISEDMAYKGHAMLSPEMARRHLLPVWRRWGEVLRAAGVPVYAMDSDGYVGELVPLWIEAGIQVCDPIEVAAGNDIVAMRQTYGQDIAFQGGFDKREMARGGVHLEREMERLLPVIRGGGYICGCDHGVPADVPWAHYVHFCRLLGRANGWL